MDVAAEMGSRDFGPVKRGIYYCLVWVSGSVRCSSGVGAASSGTNFAYKGTISCAKNWIYCSVEVAIFAETSTDGVEYGRMG